MVNAVKAQLERIEETNDQIIRTRNWELPVASLDGWRPFTAMLTPDLLEGPPVKVGRGVTLSKDVMAYACGPRGSCKSITISYLLAKEMRLGKPVWTNYPISFYVLEKGYRDGTESDIFIPLGPCRWVNLDNTISYYESMPLDMDKFYAFHQDLRRGAVGITELTYFVDSRSSLTGQNKLAGYQIMQIRKTANSFIYDLQNPDWADRRFGWSADFEIECADVSKMRYDYEDVGRELEEGELSRWMIKDISGLLTGVQFKKNGKLLGPFQFAAWNFWQIFPTHFIVDAYEASHSYKKDKQKKDNEAIIVTTVQEALNEFIDQGIFKIPSDELLEAIHAKTDLEVSNITLGKILSSLGITKKQNWHGKCDYYLEQLGKNEEEIAA